MLPRRAHGASLPGSIVMIATFGMISRARKAFSRMVNGIMYILSTGCQWAALPKDLPPRSTVNGYFLRWEHDRTLDRLHHAL